MTTTKPESLATLVEEPRYHAADITSAVVQLASDPQVDVVKLERLIGLQRSVQADQAARAFHAAFAKMQPHLPEIGERGDIIVKGVKRSSYAKLEDIHRAIKPILAEHGFGIRHRSEWPEDKPGIIRIVGILSHEHGHSEQTVFEAPADKSDYRTDIQSMGSTVSYGRRYTTLEVLNISTRGMDDDGVASGREVKAPEGFEEWELDMASTAEEGTAALQEAWNDSRKDLKAYMVNQRLAQWQSMKRTASKSDKAKGAS